MNGYIEIVKIWLKSTHEIDFQFVNDMGKNIFHMACLNGSVDTIRMIMGKLDERSSKAFNEQDEEGNTPLHCACLAQNYEMVELILKYSNILNLNLKTRNLQKLTPYEMAVKIQCTNIIKLFENHFESEVELTKEENESILGL